MSGGRASEGPGCITWWGFSPARDLLSTGPVRHERNVNILLVGSGDPRHILKTISSLRDEESLHVWVIENSMELVARQLLLLYLALMPKESMGTNEKTEVFLEVFGNGEIRSQTEETLRHAASQLSLAVTETVETATHPCLNTTLLKFKERDELARIFKLWIQPRPSLSSSTCAAPILMSKVWDYRVRQHLGTCYDCKKERFDWDLIMKLHEKECGVINKQQYARWRERGLAFEMREGAYQITNQSLLSSRVFSQRGDKVAVRGYWGDIVSSPYLSFGIETDDKSLLKTQNGQHIKVDIWGGGGCWSLSQLTLDEGRGTPWTGHQTITGLRDRQPFTLTFTPTGNLESPINLTCVFLDSGRKPEYPQKTHTDTRRTCKPGILAATITKKRPQPPGETDINVCPFLSSQTAQDISIATVQELFQSLSSRRGCPTTSQSVAETGEPSPSPEADPKSVTINDLMRLSGVSVTFLPMDSLNKLPEKQKYSHFFNTIYFSASCAHQLGPMMRQIAAPDAVLVVELAKYILDLNKEQEAGFAKKVASMALEAGFEPWREGQSDDVHAVFIPQRK
ncbi:dynein axonemal assembly factor 3 isoform X1 [Epinephelus lanceolatus]